MDYFNTHMCEICNTRKNAGDHKACSLKRQQINLGKTKKKYYSNRRYSNAAVNFLSNL